MSEKLTHELLREILNRLSRLEVEMAKHDLWHRSPDPVGKLKPIAETAKILGVSTSYLRAIRVAMGCARIRFIDPDQILKWLREHPDFSPQKRERPKAEHAPIGENPDTRKRLLRLQAGPDAVL